MTINFVGSGVLATDGKFAHVGYDVVLQDRGDVSKLVGFVSGLNRADHVHFLDNAGGATLTLSDGKIAEVEYFAGEAGRPMKIIANSPVAGVV
jgi:hypothetical protein